MHSGNKGRRRRFPFHLEQTEAIGDAGGHSDAYCLSFSEARTLRQSISAIESADKSLSEVSLALEFFSLLAASVSGDTGTAPQFSRKSVLRGLGQPVCFVDIRRVLKGHKAILSWGPQYRSGGAEAHLAREGRREPIAKYVQALQQQMMDPNFVRLSDVEFRNAMSARLFAGQVTNGPDGAHSKDPQDKSAILTIVSNFLSRHLHLAETGQELIVSTEGFFRSEVLSWLDAARQSSVLTETSLGNSEGGERRIVDLIDILPVVYVSQVHAMPDVSVVVAVYPTDPWFIDETIPEDMARLPNVFVGFYRSDGSTGFVSRSGCEQAELLLSSALGSLSSRFIAWQRGRALGISAGEGSKISRSWFGEGVADLLGRQVESTSLRGEDTLDFWSRFVEELLCKRIDGVTRTETFPFDRAFIIADTGADPAQIRNGQPGIRIRALEAALESIAPQDRFEFKTSFERGNRSLERDFDPTSKKVKYTFDFLAVRNSVGHIELSELYEPGALSDAVPMVPYQSALEEVVIKASKAGEAQQNLAVLSAPKLHARHADLALEAMLSAPASDAEAERRSYWVRNSNALRSQYTKEGFLFDFDQRLSMMRDVPLLAALNRIYVSKCAKRAGAGNELLNTFWNNQLEGSVESKVVVVSFEPSLSELNKRKSGGHYLDPGANKVTLILVADQDPEKSVPDIEAEREDLRLLTEMIFRQRLRDKSREIEFLGRRLSVANALTQGFFHKIKANILNEEIEPEEKIRELTELMKSLERTLKFDGSALSSIGPFSESDAYLAEIWFRGRDDADPLTNANKATLQASLVRGLRERVDAYARQFLASHKMPAEKVDFSLTSVLVPELTLEMPVATVFECFDVMLKNAVEASLSANAPRPASVRIMVTHAADYQGGHTLDLTVENTTGPVPADIWRALTSEQPVSEGLRNPGKFGSTGKGVFASRELLKNGLGDRSDIRYFRISENRVQARLQLPAKLLARSFERAEAEESMWFDTPATATEVPDILILEDDAKIFDAARNIIEAQVPNVSISWTQTRSQFEAALASGMPKLVISDLTIPDSDIRDSARPKYGVEAIEALGELAARFSSFPPVWVATSDAPDDAQKLFEEIDPDSALRQNYKISQLGKTDDPFSDRQLIVLGFKRLDETKAAKALAQRLGAYFGPKVPSQQPVAPDQAGAPGGGVLLFPLEEFESSYARLMQTGERPEFVFADGRNVPLAVSLDTWLSMTPLAELGSTRKSLRPGSNPSYHERLSMLVDEKMDGKSLPPNFRYWLLKHNVVSSVRSPEDVSRNLLGLHREASGTISKVRHELRNLYKGENKDLERLSRNLQEQLDGIDLHPRLLEFLNLDADATNRTALLKEIMEDASRSFSEQRAREAYSAYRSYLIGLKQTRDIDSAKLDLMARILDGTMMLVGMPVDA